MTVYNGEDISEEAIGSIIMGDEVSFNFKVIGVTHDNRGNKVVDLRLDCGRFREDEAVYLTWRSDGLFLAALG